MSETDDELAEYRRRANLNPLSGMSWSGFNVWGDKKSMTEVEAAVHAQGLVEQLRAVIINERAEAATRIASLTARVSELKQALEPFRDIDGEGDEDFPDGTAVVVNFGRSKVYTLTLGDFRRARSLIPKP